jgi:hypothetical protein
MPLFSHLSICEWGFTLFCIVFRVRNATFIRVSLKNLCNFLCFFTAVYESGPFDFLVFWVSVLLCLCWLGCLMPRFIIYSLLCNVSFMMFSSFSLLLLLMGMCAL